MTSRCFGWAGFQMLRFASMTAPFLSPASWETATAPLFPPGQMMATPSRAVAGEYRLV